MTFSDSQLDTLYAEVIVHFGELQTLPPTPEDQYFGKLAGSIVSQQLSTKVADVIEARVLQVVGGKWETDKVLATPPEQLRAAGLSNAKVSYIRNIAEAWSDGTVQPELLGRMEDEAVIEKLVTIKGVGRWTAEMFLIFTLARPDVFSVGDYGLRKAMSVLYGMDVKAKPAEFLAITQTWQPHRSLASRILWKSLELPSERT